MKSWLRFPLWLVSLLAVILTGGVPAEGVDGLVWKKTVPLGTRAHDVVVQGHFAYVATELGLSILNVSTPAAPQLLTQGQLAKSSAYRSQGLKVDGRYVYLAGQSAGLIVVDIQDPDDPQVAVGAKPKIVPVYGGLWDVAVKDNSAAGGKRVVYGGSLAGELYVIDITNLAAPSKRAMGLPAWTVAGLDAYNMQRLRAGTLTNGNAKITGVSVTDNGLFAVDWAYGRLYYFDITHDPLRPVFAGTHQAPFLLKAQARPHVSEGLANGVVFMLSAYGLTSGLYTVPMSLMDPYVGTRYTMCASCGYLPSGHGMDQGGLFVVPDNPDVTGQNPYVVYAGGRGPGKVHVVDAPNPPVNWADVGQEPIGYHGIGTAGVMGVATDGDYVYVAAGALGLQVYQFLPGLNR